MPYHDDMTNHPLPHPADLMDQARRDIRKDPQKFARDLAEQHFNEALDMLIENSREDMTNVICDDLRMSLPPVNMEFLITAYQDALHAMIKDAPTTLAEDPYDDMESAYRHHEEG